MELNGNIVGIQGILIECSKQTGEFIKINYKGGNEKRILHIIYEVAKFLISKDLLIDKKVPQNRTKEVNDIIFFLALNTQFKGKLTHNEDYSHLINIIPKLSKCLLANICFQLDLVEAYAHVIKLMPEEAAGELLDQTIECLRNSNAGEHIKNASVIMEAVLNKLATIELVTYKNQDVVDNIVSASTIILRDLSCISTKQAESMRKMKVYQTMGFILLELLNLLLHLDYSNNVVVRLLAPLVNSACDILQCVTIDVFCSWMEIDREDQPLQVVISNKAYLVVEKYQKNKDASDLVAMLSNFAKKPETIAERIFKADAATAIKMVDRKDEQQKMWFRSLLNMSDVFDNPNVLNCIEKWWTLCDKSAIDRLLLLSQPNNPTHKLLIEKCIFNLNIEELSSVLTAHFYRANFQWSQDINEELVRILNQNIDETEPKQILFLVFLNARQFFRSFHLMAFKSSAHLARIFDLLKDIAQIDNIGLDILMEVLNENLPNSKNVNNYIQLFETMVKSQYFTWNCLVSNVVLVLMNRFKESRSWEEFNCCLLILKHFQSYKCDLLREVFLYDYLLRIASETRCKSFLKFNTTETDTTDYCVDCLLNICKKLSKVEGKKESFPNIGINLNDPWSNYYKSLFWTSSDVSFVDPVLQVFDLSNYEKGEVDENFAKLLKILPRCVRQEWMLLLNEIVTKCGFDNTLNALTNIMILISQFAETQCKEPENLPNNSLLALKFCLQNYGAFVASVPVARDKQFVAINSLCRVLKHIPKILKLTEGMNLINAISDQALKLIAEDKEFTAQIVLINDKELCKAFAQKVLASTERNNC